MLSFGLGAAAGNPGYYTTGVVKGQGQPATGPISVPYKGRVLQGGALAAQVELWLRAGALEVDTAAALLVRHGACPACLSLRLRSALRSAVLKLSPDS
jgi:hypothetical protein